MPKMQFEIWMAQELADLEFVVRCQMVAHATIGEEVAVTDEEVIVIVVDEMAAEAADVTGLKSFCLIFSCCTNT
jgi:hypothetical protein